jgi:radical SAM protein with 4Fe4S-binding SPASM domain
MLKHMAPYRAELVPTLPARCRPLVRYRRESFGWLAAFPEGRVGMFGPQAEPLLAAGASYDECAPHLLPRLRIAPDFHFSAPLIGWVEITRRCNLRCPHCFVNAGAARNGEMSTERILSLLDEWAEMGVFTVVVTGGEPTIHRDFVEIVNHAHALGFCVGIATNGMTLGEKLLSRLPQDDVLISVSIDEAHGQGRGKESDFDYVTRRLRMVRDAGFNTSIMTTTTRDNVHGLDRVISWAVENDISLRSVPFSPMGRGSLYREMQNTTADVEAAARFWLAEEEWERVRDQKLGLCTGKVFNFLLTMVYATRRCMSGRGVCYVDSSGDVYPCTTCSGARVLCGGNVQMRSFARLWEDEWEIRGITWDSFRDACKGCPLDEEKYFCTGRCPGSSSVHNGTLHQCGMSEFQKLSVLRREELFRERIRAEPRVEVVPVAEAGVAAGSAPTPA